MKKQNPIYLFTVLMSLGVAGFVLFLLVSTLGIPFYLIALVFFMILVGFFMMMANKLTNGSFGADLEGVVKCEYCGHNNKVGVTVCENCNGLIE